MSGLRRWVDSVDRRDALLATVIIGWLALIGFVENTGSAPGGGEGMIKCRILSVSVTEPASCRPHGLAGRPFAVLGGAIRLVDGRRMMIVPNRVTSSIDFSQPAGEPSAGYVELKGWAANVPAHRPADAVLVFSAGRFVGAIRPLVHRPDVAHALRDGRLERSGYTLEVPLALLHGPRPATTLQLFAVEGGAASPMGFNCTQIPKQYGC